MPVVPGPMMTVYHVRLAGWNLKDTLDGRAAIRLQGIEWEAGVPSSVPNGAALIEQHGDGTWTAWCFVGKYDITNHDSIIRCILGITADDVLTMRYDEDGACYVTTHDELWVLA